MSFNQQVYRVGDFVYAEPKERGMDPSIVNIERLWNNQEGQQMMYGNYYYRPNETYHVTTRRFLEKVSGLIIFCKQKSFHSECSCLYNFSM